MMAQSSRVKAGTDLSISGWALRSKKTLVDRRAPIRITFLGSAVLIKVGEARESLHWHDLKAWARSGAFASSVVAFRAMHDHSTQT